MTDRKNLKIPQDVYERLKDEKNQYETWAGCLNRLVDTAEETRK